MNEEQSVKNTDLEIWRERKGDYYADSIHVTANGRIGINCGGHVVVLPIRKLHEAVVKESKQVRQGTIEELPKQTLDTIQRMCEDAIGLNNRMNATLTAICALGHNSTNITPTLIKTKQEIKEHSSSLDPTSSVLSDRWAVFCVGCGTKWTVPYQHPGKSICEECENLAKTAHTNTVDEIVREWKNHIPHSDSSRAEWDRYVLCQYLFKLISSEILATCGPTTTDKGENSGGT